MTYYEIRYSLIFIVFFIYGFSIKEPNKITAVKSSSSFNSFKNGDLILRRSNGLLGAFFSKASITDKKYSHAGFIRVINDKIYVCHYIESDISCGLVTESIEYFIDDEICQAYGVYRPEMSIEQHKKLNLIIEQSLQHPFSFDASFSLDSDSELYCTEWIYKSLKSAGLTLPVTVSNGYRYVAPDNLYINNKVKLIINHEYNHE